jgi:hypothetical protein
MPQTKETRPAAAPTQPDDYYADQDSAYAWTMFAGTMLLLGGLFNLIDGLVATTNANYYASISPNHSVQLPITNTIHTWGWVALVFGILLTIAGLGAFTGRMWARITGSGGCLEHDLPVGLPGRLSILGAHHALCGWSHYLRTHSPRWTRRHLVHRDVNTRLTARHQLRDARVRLLF